MTREIARLCDDLEDAWLQAQHLTIDRSLSAPALEEAQRLEVILQAAVISARRLVAEPKRRLMLVPDARRPPSQSA